MQLLRIDTTWQDIDPKWWPNRPANVRDGPGEIPINSEVWCNGRRVLVYAEVSDAEHVHRAVQRLPVQRNYRTSGMWSDSRTFGYLPRFTMHHDFCKLSSAASEHPAEHAALCSYALLAEIKMRQWFPKEAAELDEAMQDVLMDWRIAGSVYTSGIVNKNNPLTYHRDKGNFTSCVSAMLTFRRNISGGATVFPELNLRAVTRHNSILIFNGTHILHGVTPLVGAPKPDSYRYSVVYYSMSGMKNCLTMRQELDRIRRVRAERERKRAGLPVTVQ